MATSPQRVPQDKTVVVGVAELVGVTGALPVAVGAAVGEDVSGGERDRVGEVLREAPIECVLEDEAVRGFAEVARGVDVTNGAVYSHERVYGATSPR